jgi:CRP/FNR family transcriptional regulator
MTPEAPAAPPQSVTAHPLFRTLTDDEARTAASGLTLVSFDRGQYIFHAGDRAEHVFLLFEGLVKITYLNPGGDEKIISLVQPGGLFGALFLGKYSLRVGTARAVIPILAGHISKAGLYELIGRFPALGLNLIGQLADEQRETLARLHALLHMDAQHRLLGTLLSLARRVDAGANGWVALPASITQDDLASIACLNRSTVSTLINDLRGQGILGGRGRVTLVNRAAVEGLLNAAGLEILE